MPQAESAGEMPHQQGKKVRLPAPTTESKRLALGERYTSMR